MESFVSVSYELIMNHGGIPSTSMIRIVRQDVGSLAYAVGGGYSDDAGSLELVVPGLV